MSPIDLVAMILLVVGGLNWGLVGLLDINVVAMLFGAASVISKAVYVLVGLSAVYSLGKMFMKK